MLLVIISPFYVANRYENIFCYRYGLECLFRFFSYGLEKHFRDEIYNDFQEETIRDMECGQLYGLEKFWAFLKYYKNSGNLPVQDQLKERVSKYKSIEDFRVEMVRIRNLKFHK